MACVGRGQSGAMVEIILTRGDKRAFVEKQNDQVKTSFFVRDQMIEQA